jgi:hypothetical protein
MLKGYIRRGCEKIVVHETFDEIRARLKREEEERK